MSFGEMESGVKFYLAERVPVTLQVTGFRNEGGAIVASAHSPLISWTVDNIRCVNATADEGEELCDKLRLALQNRELSLHMNVSSIKCYSDVPNEDAGQTEFRVTFAGASNSELGSRLKLIFGKEEEADVFLQVEIPDWTLESEPEERFTTAEMKLALPEEGNTLQCVDDTLNTVLDNLVHAYASQSINGHMNLLLIAKDCGPSERQQMAVLKRMLEEEIAPDAVIIPSNGAEVKCHRGILATQSDVFRAMFATDMHEAKTRTIDIPDMSEEGVRAFLAYLYHWDLSKAKENCSVAVELLKAGHKYNVGSLEKAMRKLLASKPETWYNVDAAMQLFLFVWNMDAEWEALKKRAVLVLKTNSPDMKNSLTVQQLFRDNPEAAIAFCQYGFSV